MDSLKKQAGINIARLRNEKGMTQEQLAEAADLALNTLQRYEGGKRWPRPDNANKIANALGIPVLQIYQGENVKQPQTIESLLSALTELQKENSTLKSSALSSLDQQVLTLFNQLSEAEQELMLNHLQSRVQALNKKESRKA